MGELALKVFEASNLALKHEITITEWELKITEILRDHETANSKRRN
jgi:hypothetical protein